jgi:hypothetical protein
MSGSHLPRGLEKRWTSKSNAMLDEQTAHDLVKQSREQHGRATGV